MSFGKDQRAIIDGHIASHGQSVISVFDVAPSFTYTIGLNPELLVFCLPPEQATELLNAFAAYHRSQAFQPGEMQLRGMRCAVRLIECSAEARRLYTCQAGEWRGHQDYGVLQILVPDKTGAFPPDCAEPYDQQPILGGPQT